MRRQQDGAANGDAAFYRDLRAFDRFDAVASPSTYAPVPAGWWVGMTDVESSTDEIARGRYKAVNFAGASIIAALTNALPGRAFPYVFGGDGASFALPPEDEPAARAALAATAAWSRDALGLPLRAALVPVAEARGEGRDVRVARYAPSAHVRYAMFAGGGLAWCERALKDGRYAVAPAPRGTQPDLSGLSCRWATFAARRGVILSMIVAPMKPGDARYSGLLEGLVAWLGGDEAAQPLPPAEAATAWPTPGFELEVQGMPARVPLAVRRFLAMARTRLAHVVLRNGIRVGRFDPSRYFDDTVANSDYRKYDDQLRATIDCTPAVADQLERRLESARREGIARFGVHRQDAAMMTCFVPSSQRRDHVHFVDGAAGGYAMAARGLK